MNHHFNLTKNINAAQKCYDFITITTKYQHKKSNIGRYKNIIRMYHSINSIKHGRIN